MNKFIFKIKSLFFQLKNAGIKDQIIYDKSKWAGQAQKGEFDFHINNKWRDTEDFTIQSKKLFETFGFSESEYEHKNILDLGAGSKLRTKFFKNANLYVVEPLADKFIESIAWCDLKDSKAVYSLPAEQRIDELKNKMDLVVSINVIDHCYNFVDIINNLKYYLSTDGVVFLSFDKHGVTDEMHPLILNEEICDKIFTDAGFKIVKKSTGVGELFKTYGHGEYCLNYWLTH